MKDTWATCAGCGKDFRRPEEEDTRLTPLCGRCNKTRMTNSDRAKYVNELARQLGMKAKDVEAIFEPGEIMDMFEPGGLP